MRGLVVLLLAFEMLTGCENGGKIDIRADSVKKEIDTSLSKLKDSAKAKGERTLDAVKQKLNELGTKRDSIRIDTN